MGGASVKSDSPSARSRGSGSYEPEPGSGEVAGVSAEEVAAA